MRTRTSQYLALAAVLVLGACSSSSGGSSSTSSTPPSTNPRGAETDVDVAAVIEQLAAESVSGSIKGTVTIGGESGGIRGRFSGTDLLTNGRGTLVGDAPFSTTVPLDVAWRDGQLASRRAAGVSLSVWPSALLVQSATPLPVVAPIGVFAGSIEPVFPPALLARVAGLEPATDEPIKLNGADARRVTFSYADPTFKRPTTLTLTFADGPRLARVRVKSGLGELISVLDYRVALGQDGPIDVEMPAGTGTAPSALAPEGPYVEKLAGTAAGFEWRVLRAPGRAGIECWRVESTPPISVSAPNFEDARCVAELSTKDPTPEQVQVVLTSDGSASPAVIVVRVPSRASDARLGFPGAKLRSVEIKDGLIVWAGENDASPVYLQVKLGDELVECGTGAVSQAKDLSEPSIADVRLGLAWTCDVW